MALSASERTPALTPLEDTPMKPHLDARFSCTLSIFKVELIILRWVILLLPQAKYCSFLLRFWEFSLSLSSHTHKHTYREAKLSWLLCIKYHIVEVLLSWLGCSQTVLKRPSSPISDSQPGFQYLGLQIWYCSTWECSGFLESSNSTGACGDAPLWFMGVGNNMMLRLEPVLSILLNHPSWCFQKAVPNSGLSWVLRKQWAKELFYLFIFIYFKWNKIVSFKEIHLQKCEERRTHT